MLGRVLDVLRTCSDFSTRSPELRSALSEFSTMSSSGLDEDLGVVSVTGLRMFEFKPVVFRVLDEVLAAEKDSSDLPICVLRDIDLPIFAGGCILVPYFETLGPSLSSSLALAGLG